MLSRTKLLAVGSASLVAGIGLAVLVAIVWGIPGMGASSDSSSPAAEGSEDAHEHAEAESDVYYTCPMHPSVIQDEPGACPVCGMDLVKKTKSGAGMDPQELAAMGRVSLSPTKRVLANVKTAGAKTLDATSNAATEIRSVGIVAYDETGLATIPSWVDGRIEQLYIEETGAVVQQGQPVMKIYSPELLAAQEEYLVARSSSIGTLAKQVKKRLQLLGMSDAQIAELKKSGEAREYVDATAPNTGTITEMNVRQGQYVKEGEPLYDIADLSTVWVEAEVYEDNLASISEGMDVRVKADAFPGELMQGTVTFIHPVVDSDTRTAKVRVELENPDNKLKPGMYTAVFFQKASRDTSTSSPELVVPKSSVIRGGKTNSVYVEVEENVFERREVELGRATDDFLVIKSGVEPGEQVAYSGGFLLDSEVQLNSFGGSSGGHEGMDMGGEMDRGEKTSAPVKKLEASDIPEGGKNFDPMIPVSAVPEGMWTCDMNGKTHWVQHEKGDGKCPECGMNLVEKKAPDAPAASKNSDAKSNKESK